MLKKFLCVAFFIVCLFYAITDGITLYNQEVIVAKNFSSGGFYKSQNYSICDAFLSSGICKSFESSFDYQNDVIKKYGGVLVKESNDNGVTNLYYYSKKLPNKVYVDGKQVNVHIAVKSNEIVIGYPFIYYGY